MSASVRSGKATIREAFAQCRASTLDLFSDLNRETICTQLHPEFSPIGWHLGHIGFTERLWILEKLAGEAPADRDYRRLFAADGLPKVQRQHLPNLAQIRRDLEQIRDRVFAYLDTCDLDTPEVASIPTSELRTRLWWWLLQHECQHSETISLLLNLSDRSCAPFLSRRSYGSTAAPCEMVTIPAGDFFLGNNCHSQDNARPAHWVYLNSYQIDRYPVTCAQYRQFIAAGGYRDRRWWSEAGWQWLQANPVAGPLYWPSSADWENHPVCGVSWFEADAYARFASKRLPTEAEWEKAASWDEQLQIKHPHPWGRNSPTARHSNHDTLVGHTTPVDAYPAGCSPSGCYDCLGNVWEWTASWFESYEGFEPYPYRGYSQAYFDRQHKTLRGGSWATRPWALDTSWRNWYRPHVRQAIVGFRCAR